MSLPAWLGWLVILLSGTVLPAWHLAVWKRIAAAGSVRPATTPRPSPERWAQALLADHGLSTAVRVGGRTNRFVPARNAVHLTPEIATRTDAGAFAITAHEVSHALRHHRGALLTQMHAVLNKRVAVVAFGVSMVSLLAKAIEAKILVGPVLADLLGSPAVLATGTVVYGAAISAILLDEWRTSFPEAMRLMSTSGLFTDEEIAWGAGALRASFATHLMAVGALPPLVVAIIWL